jgi:hypothetical protein
MLINRRSVHFTFFLLIWISSNLFAVAPSGYYYFAKNKKKSELKTALHQIAAPQKVLDYGSGAGFTWEGFFFTDKKENGAVYDMYSNIVRYFDGYRSVSGMHIEHSLPKSWWGAHENNAYKDLYHLYPADGVTNSTKNNFPLGEVTGTPSLDNGVSKVGKNGFGTTYFDNCFEPADEYKGDFARSYFYISTIYQNFATLWNSPMMNNNTYPVWKPWAIDLLMKWHKQDPVSNKERARIEAVYAIQGNRNPFIDYPDLVDYIWGADTTKIFPFPEETNPFLLTPRHGAEIDFGVILQNDTRIHNLRIQGVNISSDIQVSLRRGSATLSLSQQTISSTAATNCIVIAITFTPTIAGWVRDTVFISGGGLSENLLIPLKALASADFITLEPTEITPVGGRLQWISDPQATDYKLSVYQGDSQAGDLIISAYVEGSSWNKAIQLYNGTGRSIDLSKYSLQKQSNGAGSFGSTLRLSGTLHSGQSYVLVHRSAPNPALIAKANITSDSLVNFNGNDAVALVRSGVVIDMVGHANAGADVLWGLDKTLQRKRTVTHPISVYNPNEWNVLPVDSFAFLGTHQMALLLISDPFIIEQKLTGGATSYVINNLNPTNTYTYSVEAIRNGQNTPAINTMQIHTSMLPEPVAMEAINLQSTSFVANWEEDLYTNDFLVDVFQLVGSGDITETESFDTVGANGKPLSEGWSGNASGNYTTAASSGKSPNSISLKNNGEWLQTKTYPDPVTKFTYMYRFPSAATGSSFVVDGLANDSWIRIDSIPYAGTLAKTYPLYNFQTSQNIRAIRFIYNKSVGNLAIDDVEATYGHQDTIFVLKNQLVSGNQFLVSELTPNSTYYYRVRSTLRGSVSAYSEVMKEQTNLDSGTDIKNVIPIKINRDFDNIHIRGLSGNENIRLYNLSGICLYHSKASGSECTIKTYENGMMIIHIRIMSVTLYRKF